MPDLPEITAEYVESEETPQVIELVQTQQRKYKLRTRNELGMLCKDIRKSLGISNQQWGKELGVSLYIIRNIERTDKVIPADIAISLSKLVYEKAPNYVSRLNALIAPQLGVTIVPNGEYSQALKTSQKAFERVLEVLEGVELETEVLD